mgnify:FL=1|tara:strand:+ start:50 stop:769 length:720 start_codon:yes stop_codon:yes gene_type:complete
MAGIKYQVAKVSPKILASKQHVQYDSGDVVFDWAEIQAPRGASRLKSITMISRDHAAAKPADFAGNLYIGDSNEVSFGTSNAAAAPAISSVNNIVATIPFATSDWDGTGAFYSVATIATDVVVTPKSGGSLYVAMDSATTDEPDFQSAIQINEADADAGTQSTITIDGGVDVTKVFAAGDVLKFYDGSDAATEGILGTVSSVPGTHSIALTAGNTEAFDNNDYIYLESPIKLIFGFEYV